MASPTDLPAVYRGGPSLKPMPRDVKVDPTTGLLQPTHGISVNADPAKVARFGGAYRLQNLPAGLKVQQRGKDPNHYEVMPAVEMTMQEYEGLLNQIKLQPPAAP